MTHICVSKLTIISWDNGLSPGRRQAIIWTNAGKLLFGPPGTNFSEILIEIHTFSFKKMYLKMSSGKWRPFLSRPQCVKTNLAVNNARTAGYNAAKHTCRPQIRLYIQVRKHGHNLIQIFSWSFFIFSCNTHTFICFWMDDVQAIKQSYKIPKVYNYSFPILITTRLSTVSS